MWHTDYRILGDQVATELLGETKFDPSFLFKAAGEITEGGMKYKEQKDAEEKRKRDLEAGVQKAVAADAAWANAEANAEVARGGALAPTMATLAQQAAQAASAASIGLPQEGVDRRVAAAQEQAKAAADEVMRAPTDKGKLARLTAWQKVAQAAAFSVPAGVFSATSSVASYRDTFWTKKYWGIPGWGLAIGGTALVGGLIYTVMRLRK